MSQASDVLQQLVKIFSCSRRNTDSRMDLKKAYGGAAKIGGKGGASLGCRSTESTEVDSDSAKSSACGSDTDDSSVRLRTQKSAKPPSVLSGPPGLELPVGEQYTPQKHGVDKRSNEEAKIPVPETCSRNHKLEECLRHLSASPENDLESSLGFVLKKRLQRERDEKSNPLPSLEKILRKLSAEDAAILKVAFGAKEASREKKTPQTMRFPHCAEENTHRSHLQKLANIESKRVIMVRKINKLGLSSPEMLKTYFSKFGSVENVYVAHSVDKRHLDEDPQAEPIILPASFGYIVMEQADDVFNVFHHGLEHTISDVSVSVTAYEHHEEVGRKEYKFGLPSSSQHTIQPRGPRFPTYTNITDDNTLRANLRKMSDVDASRIFMVRRINKLGFGSAQMLKTYFDKLGVVTDVFVTHTLDRRKMPQGNPHARPNVRPAGMGFVVMEKAEDVAAIFREGFEHSVFGVTITLSAYEHQIPAEDLA